MKRILLLLDFIGILLILVLSKTYFAQAQTAAQVSSRFAQYNISFPIVELGNCNSPLECKTFCDDPLNHQTCIDFAKKKGFYKGNEYRMKRAIALSDAQKELGCNSLDSCRQICEQANNQDRCIAFAKEHHLKGGLIANPENSTILQKAQTILGCNSYESCKYFCSQKINRDKCNSFAQTVGLSGGTAKEGPGGCTSIQSCQTYCSDPNNFNTCAAFAKTHEITPSGAVGSSNFVGPGGCTSEVGCREYCQKNPTECTHVMNQSNLLTHPTGTEQISQPGSNFQQHPQNYDPATYCKQTPGCTWTGTTCQCSPSNTISITPTQSTNSSSTSQPTSSNTTSSQLIDCTGPDGKHFQTTQQQCTDFNAAWHNYPTSPPSSGGSSGGSTGGSNTSTSTSTSNQQSSSCGSDPACWCRQCGGTWTGSTCNNPTSCH